MHPLDPATLQSLLASSGYLAVFVIVACESMGLPLPGETALISAAIYAGTTHHLDIAGVITAATAGAIAGDNLGFWIGRRFGSRIIARFGPRIGLDERRQKLGRYLFRLHGGKIVFFGRFVALLRAFAALLAGVNGVPPGRFFLFNATGAFVWASLFGLGGYLLGAGIHEIAGPVGKSLLIIALIAGFFLWRFYKRNEELFLQRAEQAMDASSPRNQAIAP